jgi:two-component system nitrogen regulation response regulator NtrX
MSRILVVDDESGIRELLSDILQDEGHDVLLAADAASARQARLNGRPDLVLLDIWMPDTDGITLLKEWAASGQLTMPVIMMSGHGSIDTAVEAVRIGALDFLEKPIGLQQLLTAVKKALASRLHPESHLSLAAFPRSPILRDLKKRLDQMAARTAVIFLRTPPGGIVELAARSLQIPGRPWVDLSAQSQPISVDFLQDASAGVLYCEELALLGRMQQKNLQFALERLSRFNLRLIAATSLEMSELSQRGMDQATLRHLFDVWLGLPALAQIRDDIPAIASHLLRYFADSDGVALRHLAVGAQNALRQHAWTEGYRELRNAVRSLSLSALGDEITEEDVRRHLFPGSMVDPSLPSGLSTEMMSLPLREAREHFERAYLQYHLQREGGVMNRLAEKTGLERTHLYRKLKDLGLRGSKE